jgi:hypothetical protein
MAKRFEKKFNIQNIVPVDFRDCIKMSPELDIYSTLVNENPYYNPKLSRIRLVTKSKYSDKDIKKALNKLREQGVVSRYGIYYGAGRKNLENEINLAIAVNIPRILENNPRADFIFNRNFPMRTRLEVHRNVILRDRIYKTLDIYLGSLRFEMGLPFGNVNRFGWFGMSDKFTSEMWR